MKRKRMFTAGIALSAGLMVAHTVWAEQTPDFGAIADQAIIDLLYKSLATKVARAKQALAEHAGNQVGRALSAEDQSRTTDN